MNITRRQFIAGLVLGLASLSANGAAFTNYCENKIIDYLMRGQAFTPPANWHVGLIRATRGMSNSVRSTAVASGDTVIPATPNGRLYRASTAGTTGAGEPTWCVTDGCTTSDGSAVWTEMTPDFEAWTNITEVSTSGTNYARVQITSSLTNWSGTQGSTTTAASTGSAGITYNINTITFGAPSTTPWGVIFGDFLADANTAGNVCVWAPLIVPKTVNASDPAPVYSPASKTVQIDN